MVPARPLYAALEGFENMVPIRGSTGKENSANGAFERAEEAPGASSTDGQAGGRNAKKPMFNIAWVREA